MFGAVPVFLHTELATKSLAALQEMAEVSFTGYGKNDIRLMRVRREGEKYSVTELKVNVELQLETTKDYHEGDNSDVVATDSQKNTVLALALQNTVFF